MGLVATMPSEYYESGFTPYSGETLDLPDAFDAWAFLPRDVNISHNLIKGGGVTYDFNAQFNTSGISRYRIIWNTILTGGNRIKVYYMTLSGVGSFGRGNLTPIVTRDTLASNFDPDTNSTQFIFTGTKGNVVGVFKDQNLTRNNVIAGFDNNELKCELLVPDDRGVDKDLGARDIVLAILTFRVPQVFSEISPALGFTISASVVIPLLFVFYAVIMWGLHGE